MPIKKTSGVAARYDKYYSKGEGTGEKSVYRNRFGAYAIPASEIYIISQMAGEVLCKKLNISMAQGTEPKELLKSLQKHFEGAPNPHPEAVYRFLIEQALYNLEEPPPRMDYDAKPTVFPLLARFDLSAGDLAGVFASDLTIRPAKDVDLASLRGALKNGARPCPSRQ